MVPGTSKKIAIVALALLTLGLGAVAVVIGLDLFGAEDPQVVAPTPPPVTTPPNVISSETSSTSTDTPVAGGSCCGGGYCAGNDWQFGGDNNYSGSCEDRKAAIAASPECQGAVVGSDAVACPSQTTSGTTSNNSQNCQPVVAGGSISVPSGCGSYRVFRGARELTGPTDSCVTVQNGDYSDRTAGFTITPSASKCFCVQEDVIWNNTPYGVTVSGGWDASCEATSSTSTSTPTTTVSSSTSTNTTTATAADITVAKNSVIDSCVIDGSSVINYTVTVSNLGTSAATIDEVVDTLESPIGADNISNISNGGAKSGRVITWNGPLAVAANSNITFTYTVTVSAAEKEALGNNIENIVEATFGSNTRSFTQLTNVSCLPNTGLFDEDGRPLLIGLILIILGLVANRSTALFNWGWNSGDDAPEFVKGTQHVRSKKRKNNNRRFENKILDEK